MFERYILGSNFERIERRFNMAKLPDVDYFPSYNIAPGDG
jgi:hypothetical protein